MAHLSSPCLLRAGNSPFLVTMYASLSQDFITALAKPHPYDVYYQHH